MSEPQRETPDSAARRLPEPITLTPEQAKRVAAGLAAAISIPTTTTGVVAPPPATV